MNQCSTKSLDKSSAGCHWLELAQPGFIKWVSPEIRFCDKKHNLETRIVRASGKVTSQMIEIMSRHSTVAFRRHPTIPYQFIYLSLFLESEMHFSPSVKCQLEWFLNLYLFSELTEIVIWVKRSGDLRWDLVNDSLLVTRGWREHKRGAALVQLYFLSSLEKKTTWHSN